MVMPASACYVYWKAENCFGSEDEFGSLNRSGISSTYGEYLFLLKFAEGWNLNLVRYNSRNFREKPLISVSYLSFPIISHQTE